MEATLQQHSTERARHDEAYFVYGEIITQLFGDHCSTGIDALQRDMPKRREVAASGGDYLLGAYQHLELLWRLRGQDFKEMLLRWPRGQHLGGVPG